MIEEKHIEACLVNLENEVSNDKFLAQEDLLEYLKSDTFSSLSASEKKILFFCFEVIFYSFENAHNKIPEFDIDDYLEAEEENWHVREEHSNWAKTVDSFFKNYSEEDLLAFLEDTLVEDDDNKDDGDNEISEIAKEFIFISGKSYIDAITN